MVEIKVSVIIPTYKPKDYLWTCFDSLVNQTFDHKWYEIIVVLNGCDNPYHERILKYVNLHRSCEFIIVQTDEGGVSNARNIGIDKARGEYIAFIDDDDFVSPSYIGELYEKADAETVSLAYPFAFNDGNESVQLDYRITEEYNRLLPFGRLEYYKARKYFSGPCMKMIRREIIGDRRFNKKLKNGEDTLFMFEISDKIKYVRFATKETIYYRRFRINSATTTGRNFRTKVRDNLVGLRAYFSTYMRNPIGYNFIFFLTRVMGAVRGMFI